MKKDYKTLKTKAVKLRQNGLSYKEIKEKINVPKSTLSYWLKDVPLKPEHRVRLYTKQVQILSRGSQSQKERRAREVERIIKEAKKDVKTPVTKDTWRLLGAALYWAEGSKGKRFHITNSDPALILFMVNWIEEIFEVPARELKARLNIYPQQSEKDIKSFWADLTGIPIQNFGKSYVKPKSKNYKKNNLYYGTIRVEVPKSTDFVYKVFAWIERFWMKKLILS